MPSAKRAKVEWKKETEEDLPSGWTKIIKCQKIGDKIRKDAYYIDPATGYIFRSKRDVSRYLSTGDVGRLAFKPKNGCLGDFDMDEITSSPTTAKRQQVEDSSITESVLTAQTPSPNKMTENGKILEPSPKKEFTPVLEQAVVHSEESPDLGNLTTPKPDSKEMVDSEPSKLVSVLPPPKASSENQKQEQKDEGLNQRRNTRSQLKSSKTKDTKELSLPRRASKRLAGISAAGTSAEPISALDNSGPEISQEKNHHVAPVLEAIPVTDEKVSNSTNQVPELVDQTGSAEESKSTTAPKVDNEHEKLLLESKESREVEKQPVIPEADSGNKGTEQRANVEPELELPFGDSWPDPCLEFAFKTLTGEIPVEDNLLIEDYFQHLGSSVQTQSNSDFGQLDTDGVGGFCQTSNVFQSEAPHPPVRHQLGSNMPQTPMSRQMQSEILHPHPSHQMQSEMLHPPPHQAQWEMPHPPSSHQVRSQMLHPPPHQVRPEMLHPPPPHQVRPEMPHPPPHQVRWEMPHRPMPHQVRSEMLHRPTHQVRSGMTHPSPQHQQRSIMTHPSPQHQQRPIMTHPQQHQLRPIMTHHPLPDQIQSEITHHPPTHQLSTNQALPGSSHGNKFSFGGQKIFPKEG